MSIHLEISQGLRVDDLEELQRKVRLRGGQLIAYSEVISAIFISARDYRVRWVAPHGDRYSAGILSTVITSLLGWWAFVGPYWSLSAIIWNCRGGYDVTESLLRAHPSSSYLLSYSQNLAIEEFQESVSGLSMKICIGLVIAVVGFLAYVIWSVNTS